MEKVRYYNWMMFYVRLADHSLVSVIKPVPCEQGDPYKVTNALLQEIKDIYSEDYEDSQMAIVNVAYLGCMTYDEYYGEVESAAE